MSKAICDFTNSNYGVGVTGKLNRVDKYNPYGNDSITYICIYDKDNNKYYTMNVESTMNKRSENKELIINNIIKELLKII